MRNHRRSRLVEAKSPKLFEASDTESDQIKETAAAILKAGAPYLSKLPNSLTTKWLHFCFPDTFVIVDSQAARSIQTRARYSFFYSRNETSRFMAANTLATDGSGYADVVDFYQALWMSAIEGELTQTLNFTAQTMEKFLASTHGITDAKVSMLDMIDKHIWKADGLDHILGLT